MNEDIKKDGTQETVEQDLEQENQTNQQDKQEAEGSEEALGEKEAESDKSSGGERDKYLRLQAEFINYKKRVEKEKSEIYKNASAKLITDLLPVLDDFDRALAHTDDTNSFKDGIGLIVKRFEDCLKKEGLEVIETLNIDFDPNYHHAVLMEETDQVESGKIFEEVQKGYKVNGKVIRPAMVKVAK